MKSLIYEYEIKVRFVHPEHGKGYITICPEPELMNDVNALRFFIASAISKFEDKHNLADAG